MNALFKYALIIEYQVLKAIVFHLLYSDKLLGVACHARSKHNNGLQIKNGAVSKGELLRRPPSFSSYA